MKKVGLIGWRGMVGSVLIERMLIEGDFEKYKISLFSTSQAGQQSSDFAGRSFQLKDAFDLEQLKEMDALISCQGGSYSEQIHSKLRECWQGFWIDAASSLRLKDSSCIVLDPVNRMVIDQKIERGCKDFIGGNCTVSLLLMALAGLIKEDLIESISTMTYQAASGGGAQHMRELLKQIDFLSAELKGRLDEPILKVDRLTQQAMQDQRLPVDLFQSPLALNLIPWIDSPVENGMSREEWKAQTEARKILARVEQPLCIDGLCVRIGALRSHSQGLTIKLKQNLSSQRVEELLAGAHEWIEVIENTPDESRKKLCPSYVSGGMKTAIGRIRPSLLGANIIHAFTVGDQLLWGAAEPLRRMLGILL